MKYLKPINESEKAFDFGYEREIIEDFIEEMGEFGISSSISIKTSNKWFKSFDELLTDKTFSWLPGKDMYLINVEGRIKNNSTLNEDQYTSLKLDLDDFKDKIVDLTKAKIYDLRISSSKTYRIFSNGQNQEHYSDVKYFISIGVVINSEI